MPVAPSRARAVALAVAVAVAVAMVLTALAPVPGGAVSKSGSTSGSKASSTAKKSTAKSTKRPTLVAVRRTAAQRAAVRQRRAAAAARVNALKADRRQLANALADLTDDVKAQSASLRSARNGVVQAEQELVEAREAESVLLTRIDALGKQRMEAAMSAYAAGGDADISSVLRSATVNDAAHRSTYIDLAYQQQADLADQYAALEEDLAIERQRADRAQRQAVQRREQVATNLKRLEASKARTARFAVSAEERYEAALAEAVGLETLDRALSTRLRAEQADLERRLNAARRAGVGGSGDGAFSGSIRVPGNVQLGRTNGIIVASSIRGNLAALLAAAADDGVFLSGSGYRSSASQVALRQAHCGSSSYAIYQMRASSCRPPTARPGSSQHERGLAIDFTQNGRTLTRSSSGYRWLKGNAHRFGLYNLPSEPWHWSTTGR
jgi:hypothetical protein